MQYAYIFLATDGEFQKILEILLAASDWDL